MKTAIIGAGLIGSGWAIVFARAGFEVARIGLHDLGGQFCARQVFADTHRARRIDLDGGNFCAARRQLQCLAARCGAQVDDVLVRDIPFQSLCMRHLLPFIVLIVVALARMVVHDESIDID